MAMTRPSLLLACLSLASASSSRPACSTERSRRTPRPLAFRVTDTVYDVTPQQLAQGRPYLIQFTGKGDDYCAQMEPLKQRLKDELGIEIKCFEVWYGTPNLELLQKLDRGRCGGVPFFYNKKTRRFICGATTYANLKAWALNQACEPFLPPPAPAKDNQQPNEVQSKVQGFFAKLKSKAEEKMAERRASTQ